MELKQVKDYRQFAEMLQRKTGCSVTIELKGRDASHVHYQLDDEYGMSLGVLCVQEDSVAFAPFVTHANQRDEQYINLKYMPQFGRFIDLLTVFQKMFVIKYDEMEES